jgi:hypothetical protein
MESRMGLLQDIETAATDSTIPIVDLLRKCKVLASRLRHQEFSDWINKELNGYPIPKEIPQYRRMVFNNPIGNFIGPYGSEYRNAPIPPSCIPEEIREMVTNANMAQPIAELEELSKTTKNLQHAWTGDLIAYMDGQAEIYHGMRLRHAHSVVSPAMLKGIVDTVRTRLLDYVLAIQIESPEVDSIKPSDPAPISSTTLHQTFNTTILGGQANIGSHGSQTMPGTINTYIDSSVKNILSDEKVLELMWQLKDAAKKTPDDEEEASDALMKVESQLTKPKPDIERIKSYLDIAGHLVKLAPVAKQLYLYIAQHLK